MSTTMNTCATSIHVVRDLIESNQSNQVLMYKQITFCRHWLRDVTIDQKKFQSG